MGCLGASLCMTRTRADTSPSASTYIHPSFCKVSTVYATPQSTDGWPAQYYKLYDKAVMIGMMIHAPSNATKPLHV